MLAVVQFENGKYGLQNEWTGIVIDKQFRTIRGALRYRRRSTDRLSKTIRRLSSPIKK